MKNHYPLMRPIHLLLIVVGLAHANVSLGQQFSIATPSITTCTGVLEDTGGPSGQYANGENFTTVICPDVAGDGISLLWAVFGLSTQGPNPPDRIRIWDGNSTTETFLGEYTGNDLQGLVTSSTTFNPSGCLTVQFISNANGVGNFAAAISCFTPCERPVAVATMTDSSPALLCVGETITFDGSGSYAAPGFNITEYTWNFDDGTNSNDIITSHSFAEPGEYIVQLNLIDDNSCVNSNVVDLQVLVSTTPIFSGTIESLVTCLGATINLNAVVEPVTWTGIPEANFGDGVYLPDDVGTPFSSDLVFAQFEPGQTLTDVNDLTSICVSMEHSFMGDLVLSVTCPDGSVAILHQQGGGGTFIGDANDGDGNTNPVAGTCWDYCWSASATLGTWEQSSQFGASPNTMASSQGEALIPGTYSSLQPLTNFIGCPLNGTWTFTSLDLWGADNGFLCNWSINFDPSIIPDVTQFTPELGTSTLDSASWSGPDLVLDPNNPLAGVATPTGPGSYTYAFNVTDNFGCAYDTSITVVVEPQMIIDAGPDIILCSDPEPMAGSVIANGPPENCDYILELEDTWGDGWNGASITVTIDGAPSSYTMTTGSPQLISISVSTGQSISLSFTPGAFNNEHSFALYNGQGTVLFQSPLGPATGIAYNGLVDCTGGASTTTWIWTPAVGLDDESDPETNVYITAPTMYTLSAYPVGHPECAVFDSVLVSPDPSIDAGLDNILEFCASMPDFLLTDSLQGTPDANGVWTDGSGAVVNSVFEPLTGASGDYVYTVTSAGGCVATSLLSITVIPADDPTCCGIPDAGEDQVVCALSAVLTATPGNTGVGEWSGPAGAVFDDVLSTTTGVTVQPGMGGEHWFYWIENDGAFCNTIDSVKITFTDAIEVDFIWTDAVCYTYCDGTVRALITGGNVATAHELAWSTGDAGVGLDELTGLCADTYLVTVTDDNGCFTTDSVQVSQPVQLEIMELYFDPVTCSGDCDGRVVVNDARAVEYSFDGGATWGASNTLENVCEELFQVWIKDQAGCLGSELIIVDGPPEVVSDFTWIPEQPTVEQPTVEFVNTTTGAERYFWNIADLLLTTEPEPTFTFTNKEPGVYNVCLVSYNMNECVDTMCYNVVVDDVLQTFIPNSFTPDGDLLNDTWGLSVNMDVITAFELVVFDRWGRPVFQSTDPSIPWEGRYQNGGDVLPEGVYAYQMTYTILGTDNRKQLVGYVTIIK